MENLRRILIPWTDNGYNFHFDSSDTIHTYVVIITNVVKNSPAEEAGLRVGDGIVSINGNLLRNLTESEIYSLINNFRNTTLKLTVLQNITNNNNVINNNNNDNDKNKKVAQLSYGGQKFSHDFQKYCVPRIGPVGGSKEVPKTSKRKFSKYSRNMSDVTQNSRFYCQSLKKDTIRRSSSPLKESESSYYHVTSVNLLNPYPSPNQLQLNRVGGIMRKPVDPNTKVHNNLFMTKTDKSEMRRNTKLTYLTCSPIPYRSCRVVDPIIKQERPSKSEVVVQERIHKQLSIDIPEVSSNGVVAEKNVPRISYICSEHDMNNIDPIAVMIMWKIKENSEVLHPAWQCCTISVDKGMFQVKENEHEFCCGTTTMSTSTSMENKNSGVQSSMDIKEIVNTECAEQKNSGNNSNNMVYNFIYNDTNQRKWEFLLEFSDSKKSIAAKWMHFFDHATQSQSQSQSQPQQEEIDEEYCKTEFINPNLTVSTSSSSSFSGLSTVTGPPAFPRCTGSPHTTNQPLESIIYQSTVKTESATGKGKFHTALSRVRNFTQRRLNNNDPTSEFKRQQEEWILKTEPHFVSVSETEESKEVAVSICTDHIGYLGDKVQIPHFATLPLDKWQRSVTSPLIPLIVEICVKVIEKFGMHYVGIYRVSGNKLSLDAINNELRRPLTDIDVTSDVWNDIYAMSGVLKSFLRSLPDGVFPKDYYFEIISAWKMYEKDREKRLLSVQRLLNILDSVPDHPEYRHHRETLKYLTGHLYSVSSKNALNKMTSKNLAVVFAPTLIRPPTETNEILMSDFRYRIELVESIINFHEWMFSPSLESACNIPPEVGEDISLLSDMQFESFGDDQMSADDKLPESQEDARVLIKDIIESVKNVSTDTFLSESDNTKYTLIELNPLNKEAKEKHSDSSLKNSIESSSRLSEEYSIDTSPETSETLSTKEKKSSKRMSFKLSKLRHGKSAFPREQLLLTNKKLCALSIALISSTRHPLNSTVIIENDPPKITVE